ncbi:hypothetical protein ACWGJB_49380 [Streptomyces sp. NPDC054813]
MGRKDPDSLPPGTIFSRPKINISLNFHRDEFDDIHVVATGFGPGEHVELTRDDVKFGRLNKMARIWEGPADGQGHFGVEDVPEIESVVSNYFYVARGDQSGNSKAAEYDC